MRNGRVRLAVVALCVAAAAFVLVLRSRVDDGVDSSPYPEASAVRAQVPGDAAGPSDSVEVRGEGSRTAPIGTPAESKVEVSLAGAGSATSAEIEVSSLARPAEASVVSCDPRQTPCATLSVAPGPLLITGRAGAARASRYSDVRGSREEIALRLIASRALGVVVTAAKTGKRISKASLSVVGASRESAVTDAQGRAKAAFLPGYPMTVTVSAEGYATKSLELPASSTDLELGVALAHGVVIEGIVKDRDGVPVAQAHVVALSMDGRSVQQALSDDLGEYSMTVGLGSFALGASKGNAASGLVSVAAVRDIRKDLVVDGGASLSGRVTTHGDGRPAGTVVVALRSESFVHTFGTAVTDADGRFSLPAVPFGNYRLFATGSKLAPYGPVLVSLNGPREQWDIAMQREDAGRVEGVVSDAEGKPVSGAIVAGGQVAASPAPRRAFSVTDDNGRFALDGLRVGPSYFECTDQDQDRRAAGQTSVAAGEATELNFKLAAPASLRGVVSFTSPRVHSVLVSAYPRTAGVGPSETLASRSTDGRFELAVVPGAYRLGVREPGEMGGPQAFTDVVVKPGGAQTQLEYPSRDVVTGLVVDSSGAPASGAIVAIIDAGRVVDMQMADSVGAFRVPRAAVSSEAVLYARRGGEVARVAARGMLESLRMALSPGTAISGRVEAPTGAEVARMEVELRLDGPEWSLPGLGPLAYSQPVTFLGDKFYFPSIPAGAHAIRVRTSDGRVGEGRVMTSAASTAQVTVRVGQATRVIGQVTDEDGAVAGAAVTVDARPELVVRTDAQGKFEIIGVESGAHTLMAQHPVRGVANVRIELPGVARYDLGAVQLLKRP